MIASERAPLGAVLAVLLTLVTLTGMYAPIAMAVLVCLLSIMVALGWPDLLELPDAAGTRVVIAGTGVLAAVLTLAVQGRNDPLWGVVVACALGVLGAFVHQMTRRRRDALSASLTGTVAGSMLTGITGTWLIAVMEATTPVQVGLLATSGAALAVTLLIGATGMRRILRVVFAVLLAGGAATLLGHAVAGLDWWVGLVIGVLVAVGAGGVHLLLTSVLVAREPRPSLATAAAPVATVGVVALLAVRLLA